MQRGRTGPTSIIFESKRLITVRRNNLYVSSLRSLGVDAVEHKDEIRIELADHELDMHVFEAQRRYARRHEALCTGFIEQVTNEV